MNTLGIFARYPQPGFCKTRLAASIGNEAAADLYAAFVMDVVERLQQRDEHCVVAYTPQTDAARSWFSKRLHSSTDLVAQPDGNLGSRIEWFFRHCFDAGAHGAVLIGSDSPDLPDAHLHDAFDRLKTSDMVLGPASDGGYVLVGLKRFVSGLFDGIPWSSPETLAATVSAARSKNLSVELLQPWYDIDTIDNLSTLVDLQQSPDTAAAACPQTQRYLQQLEGLLPDLNLKSE